MMLPTPNDVIIHYEYVGNPDRLRFYDEGPHQIIVYHPYYGIINVIDGKQGVRISIPVSRWTLFKMGWCLMMAAFYKVKPPKT